MQLVFASNNDTCSLIVQFENYNPWYRHFCMRKGYLLHNYFHSNVLMGFMFNNFILCINNVHSLISFLLKAMLIFNLDEGLLLATFDTAKLTSIG